GRQKGSCKNIDECLIAAMFDNKTDRSTYYKAARRVRTQFGLANRFLEGIEISGMYMDEMRVIFSENSLPLELLALPHVESSFNVHAYSKYGAAGIWQFTRSTGRRFMKINYTCDERLDPVKSTKAAAKLLKKNYQTLGSWPLALTAYNHGLTGMKRAKKRYGDDIIEVINNYKRRTFGFASKNFYAEFLAAAKIMEHPEKYFSHVNLNPPMRYDSVEIPNYIPVKILKTHFHYDPREIARLNPSLRPPVWGGFRRIPKGYNLKLPEGEQGRFEEVYESLPKKFRHSGQVRQKWYYVKRGDALSTIARRFRTSIASLQDINGIYNSHRIYSGQKLQIPAKGYKPRAVPVNLEMPPKIKKPEQVALVKKTVVLDKDTEPLEKLTITEEEESSPVTAPPFDNFAFESTGDGYGIIHVRPEETIGHYSYWSGVSVTQILRLNGWSRRRPIRLGQEVMVPLHRVSPETFESRRYEFHLGVFEDFFSAYSVKKVESIVVKRGQSLWTICNEDYSVPIWLVALYNPSESLKQLQPGQVLRVPVVGARES
ncbi:MAG: transglycosylase SLT domain-containing protein, partial [Nitrospinota bacterium]